MLNDDRIHVLIAHDNPLIAAGLEAAFGGRHDFYVVRRRESDDLSLLNDATVVVTDYVGGTRWLAQHGGGCRVLILTDDDSEVSIRQAMQLGISGYLPLSSGVESVVGAVRCIHNGGMAIETNIMSKMAMSLRSRGLTQREVEVLRLIMQGSRDKVIAHRLEHSVETTKTHVKAILMKLGASSRVEAAAIARRRGLVREIDGPIRSGPEGHRVAPNLAEQQR